MNEFKLNWKAYREYEDMLFHGFADIINVAFDIFIVGVGLGLGRAYGNPGMGALYATLLVVVFTIWSVASAIKLGKELRENGK